MQCSCDPGNCSYWHDRNDRYRQTRVTQRSPQVQGFTVRLGCDRGVQLCTARSRGLSGSTVRLFIGVCIAKAEVRRVPIFSRTSGAHKISDALGPCSLLDVRQGSLLACLDIPFFEVSTRPAGRRPSPVCANDRSTSRFCAALDLPLVAPPLRCIGISSASFAREHMGAHVTDYLCIAP